MDTWYDERGGGEPLVMLHPGMTDSGAFAPNAGAMAERFHVFLPDRRGHGRTPDVEGPISYELMASDTIEFVESVAGEPVHLLGSSDGAIVALFVALMRPELVRRLVLVAGVFHREGWHPSAVDWPEGLDPDTVPGKMARMHAEEPTLSPSDLAGVGSRTLLMIGDDDEVSLEHAIAFYRALPDGELAVVPGTSHGLLVEKPELCNRIVLDFLTTDPVRQMAPIRRA